MLPSTLRVHWVVQAVFLCALLCLAGCASAPVGGGAPPVGGGVAAPQLIVGDRWQYNVTDNLRRGAVSQLNAEVIAVSGRTARIRFDRVDGSGSREWIDDVDGEGGLRYGSLYGEPAHPFNPPAQYRETEGADSATAVRTESIQLELVSFQPGGK